MEWDDVGERESVDGESAAGPKWRPLKLRGCGTDVGGEWKDVKRKADQVDDVHVLQLLLLSTFSALSFQCRRLSSLIFFSFSSHF